MENSEPANDAPLNISNSCTGTIVLLRGVYICNKCRKAFGTYDENQLEFVNMILDNLSGTPHPEENTFT